MNRKRLLLLVGGGVALAFLCFIGALLLPDQDGDQPAQEAPAVAEADIDSKADADEEIALPTEIPEPTATPLPTNTPAPTNTPIPTPTNTPPPDPIIASGSGDSVVDIDKWSGPALLTINYSGGSNFVVWNFDSAGQEIDLLVNTIGSYKGTRPLDFLASEHTVRLSIESSGNWDFAILPLEEIRRSDVPGLLEGLGDDVVLLSEGEADLLVIDASSADSNFVIWGYGDDVDLLVNEIAPYTGTVIVPRGIFVLAIEAEGPWSIDVTGR